MIPKYKKVKVLKPFCSICGEQLTGDGSHYKPYKCKCGTWKWFTDYKNETMALRLIKQVGMRC